MVSCENNVFFALSDSDFSINSPTTPIASDCKTVDGDSLAHGTIFVTSSFSGSSRTGGGGGGALFLLPLALMMGAGLRRLVTARD